MRHLFSILITSILFISTSYSQPLVEAGADQHFCNEGYTMLVGEGDADCYYYIWHPTQFVTDSMELSTFVTVDTTTTFYLSGYYEANDIVVNGNFENGNSGFTSSYNHAGNSSQALYPEGTYSIVTTSNTVHPDFVNAYDHTYGNSNGHYMAVNGAGTPNTVVWQQTINVLPNTEYIFYTWVMSLVTVSSSTQIAQLQFSINNNLIGDVFSAPAATSTGWQQFYTTWNSGTATTAIIKIINQNTVLSGNDFGLDDIHFAPIIPTTDSVTIFVNYPTLSYDTVTICDGSNYDFNGRILNSTGHYTDTTLSSAGCDSIIHLQLYFSEAITVDLGQDRTFCSDLNPSFTLVPDNNFNSYLWSDSSTTPTLTVNTTGNYALTVADEMGCTAIDTVSITFIETPSLFIENLTGDFCNYYTAELFANSNAESYSWNTGENTASITVSTPGTYSVEAKNGNCKINAAYTIQECEFNLYFPNTITCNGDNLNDYFKLSSTDNIQSIEIFIYDRYGKMVFTSQDINFQWDGKINGKAIDGSVFNYQIKLKTVTGPRYLYSGSITVLLSEHDN